MLFEGERVTFNFRAQKFSFGAKRTCIRSFLLKIVDIFFPLCDARENVAGVWELSPGGWSLILLRKGGGCKRRNILRQEGRSKLVVEETFWLDRVETSLPPYQNYLCTS